MKKGAASTVSLQLWVIIDQKCHQGCVTVYAWGFFLKDSVLVIPNLFSSNLLVKKGIINSSTSLCAHFLRCRCCVHRSLLCLFLSVFTAWRFQPSMHLAQNHRHLESCFTQKWTSGLKVPLNHWNKFTANAWFMYKKVSKLSWKSIIGKSQWWDCGRRWLQDFCSYP